MDREKFLKDMGSIVDDLGLSSEDLSGFGTLGFMIQALINREENAETANIVRNNERFIGTALKYNSLVKHAGDRKVGVGRASCAKTKVTVYLNEDSFLNNADEEATYDYPATVIYSFGGIPFKAPAPITISRKGIRYTARYNVDEVCPIFDIENPVVKVVRVRYSGDWFIRFTIDVYNYIHTVNRHNFINEFNSFSINSPFDNQLVDFFVKYKDPTTDYRRISKAPYADVSSVGETIFYYTFDKYIQLINKYSTGNLYPKPNGEFLVDIYSTNGATANFDTFTGVVTVDPGEEDLLVYAESSVSAEGGIDGPDIDKIREDLKEFESTRGSVRTERDILRYIQNLDSENIFNIAKKYSGFGSLIYNMFLGVKAPSGLYGTATKKLQINLSGGMVANDSGIVLNSDTYARLGAGRYFCTDYFLQLSDNGLFVQEAYTGIGIFKTPFQYAYDIVENIVEIYSAICNKTFLTDYTYINPDTDVCPINSKVRFKNSLDTRTVTIDMDIMVDDIVVADDTKDLSNLLVKVYLSSNGVPIIVNMKLVSYSDNKYTYQGTLLTAPPFAGKFLCKPDATDEDLGTREYNEYKVYESLDSTIYIGDLEATVVILKKDSPNEMKDGVITDTGVITDLENSANGRVDIPEGYSVIMELTIVDPSIFDDMSVSMTTQCSAISYYSGHDQSLLKQISLDTVPLVSTEYGEDDQHIISKHIRKTIDRIAEAVAKVDPETRINFNCIANRGKSYLFKAINGKGDTRSIDNLTDKLSFTVKMMHGYSTTEDEIRETIRDFIYSKDYYKGDYVHIGDLMLAVKEAHTDVAYIDFNGIGEHVSRLDQSYTYIYSETSSDVSGYDTYVPEVFDPEIEIII